MGHYFLSHDIRASGRNGGNAIRSMFVHEVTVEIAFEY